MTRMHCLTLGFLVSFTQLSVAQTGSVAGCAAQPAPDAGQQCSAAHSVETNSHAGRGLALVATLKTGESKDAIVTASPESLGHAVTSTPLGSAQPALRAVASVSVTTQETAMPETVSTQVFSGKQILESAGTFQDLPRFLQSQAGVVGGSDVENAMVVRGGNSMENLYVLDKIEVPNINHLAVAGSSGGLGSMLDTNDIARVTFSTAAFASDLQTHLSSVVDIRTQELPRQATTTIDAGYSGAGVRVSRSVGLDKTLLLSARESLTNLMTSNIGINGSPEFTNSFAKYAWNASAKDHFWVDNLFGRDRLKVVPTWNDAFETNAFDTTYSGWRDTVGLVWQHTYSNSSVGTLTVSNSQQQQKLSQVDQITAGTLLFKQNDLDGSTTTRYEHMVVGTSGFSTSFGADTRLNRMHYDVAQPAGSYSPYNSSPEPQDAFSATPSFHTLDKAAFAESTVSFLERITLQAGVRTQLWGYRPTLLVPASSNAAAPEYRATMPHATLSVLATHRLSLKASYGKYADLPTYSVIASPLQNASLGLIHSTQAVVGVTTRVGHLLDVNVEAYRKMYSGYPVATDLPTVSLANTMPTINEPFTLMALSSQGRGKVQGVEATVRMDAWHHVAIDSNVAYSRALYSGLDGVFRPGNFDFPLVWNAMAAVQIKQFNLTLRNTLSSGRPYTPVLEDVSVAQNRLIYDLSQVNALRGNRYERLDFALNRDVAIRGRKMNLHVGALNVLLHHNFYTQAWRPRCPQCGETDEHQMGLVPDFGASYSF